MGLVFCVGLTTEPAHAKKRYHSFSEFRLRAFYLYGVSDYSSMNLRTLSTAASVEQKSGYGAQLEYWFGSRVGMIAEGTQFDLGDFDKAAQHASGGVHFAIRAAGHGGMMNSETVVYAGPMVTYWSNLQRKPIGNTADLSSANTLGLKLGIRWRIGITKEWAFEFGGHYGAPLQVLGTRASPGPASDSRHIGGRVLIDHALTDGIGMSLGYLFEINRLTFVPNGRRELDVFSLKANVGAVLGSVNFWF
ncbi:MAG: hypothetical protein AB1540_16315 [Bdellovibrionota bacterium]